MSKQRETEWLTLNWWSHNYLLASHLSTKTCCCLFPHDSACLSVQEQYCSPFMELGPYLTINMNLLLSLRKKRNIPEGLLFDEHMHLFPILYLKNLSYSLPYPPVPFTSGSSSPGWLYLRNTQTPSALISFFCCATPHKQEKNQEKKITKTIKAQTFTLFSVQQKQYFLNTWKRAKLTLMKKHPLKKKKKKRS